MFPENWLGHLAGIGDDADLFGLIPQVVEGEWKVKDLDLDKWMAFVDERADTSEAIVKGRCFSGRHLLSFLKEEARKVRNFLNETTNFIQTADII